MTSVVEGIALPLKWRWSQLRHVTSVVRRGTAPSYVDNGGIRVIGQASNQSGQIAWERTRFHSAETDPRKLKGFLCPNDILINSTGTGTLGRVARFMGDPSGQHCIADGHMTIVRCKGDAIDSKFAYYFLSSQWFYHFMMATMVAGATNQIELSPERLAASPVPIPPLGEQRRIAKFLDAETARIRSLASLYFRMNELLILKRERIVDSYFDLESKAGQPAVPLAHLSKGVQVGIVIKPASWYVDQGGVLALRGLNIKPGRIDTTDMVSISHEGHTAHRKSELSAGDVVVVRTGQAGAAAVIPPELDGVNCIDLVIVRLRSDIVPSYVEYLLNSSYAQQRVKEYSVGSIQAHFNVGAMKKMPVPYCSQAEQRQIVERLNYETNKIDTLIGKIDIQKKLLQEREQALVTAAVTGQIDVTTARGL